MKKTKSLKLALFIFLAIRTLAACIGTAKPEIKKTEFRLAGAVFDNAKVPFVEYTQGGPFGSYLAMNVRYEPVKALFVQLQEATPARLTNRGEAHITVITPPEFDQVLKKHLSIEEIHRLAKEMNIQNSKFEVVCLGKGEAMIDGKAEQTYYVVVTSPALVEIRRRVQQKFISRGGSPQAFNPSAFYPHITLGFSRRDLHESDGIKKGENSCDAGILVSE